MYSIFLASSLDEWTIQVAYRESYLELLDSGCLVTSHDIASHNEFRETVTSYKDILNNNSNQFEEHNK
jgi:hypothetical protein